VRLEELGIEPISERVTPHSLRRTYASLRFALGDDPVYVAQQMGHADAGRLAASIYAKAVKRRAKLSGVYLAEFDRALQWAEMGRNSDQDVGKPTAVTSDLAWVSQLGALAEWLRSGLQSRLHRFDSGRRLRL
jgi:hypothetical protein